MIKFTNEITNNKHMRFLLMLLLSTIILSCSEPDNRTASEIFLDEDVTVEEKVERALKSDYLDSLNLDSTEKVFLHELYDQRDFQPIWVANNELSSTGKKWQVFIKNETLKLGIGKQRAADSRCSDSTHWMQKELYYTIQLSQLIADIDSGYINFFRDSLKHKRLSTKERVNALVLSKIKSSPNFVTLLSQAGPKSRAYRMLQAYVLENYQDLYRTKESTVSLIDTLTYSTDSPLVGYLKTLHKLERFVSAHDLQEKYHSFQEENGIQPLDKIGNYSKKALSESLQTKLFRAMLNMDRLRHAESYAASRIWINIPEFTLRYYLDNEQKAMHKLVVGAEKTPTPEVQATLERIVLYPYWSVPASIAKNEVVPAIKRGLGYISSHNLKVYRGDVEVDPYGIDWSAIPSGKCPYRIKQEPGSSNSLGIIKFEFPNVHNVYVHDTPTKHLFANEFRAYSHGCMRCENPVKLGRTIYHYDTEGNIPMEIDSNKLDQYLAQKQNMGIKLEHPIPVYVEYRSVITKDSKLIFLVDIYDRDKTFFPYLFNPNKKS